ncbi:MAG: sensor histidine kinase [Lachnospiraceae bacterium]
MKNKDKIHKKLKHLPDGEKMSARAYGIAFVLMTVLLVYLGMSNNVHVTSVRKDAGYETIEDYRIEEEKDEEAPIGVHKVYTWTLPEVKPQDHCLAFYVVHQSVRVYLEDELIYRLVPDENLLFGKTIGSSWVMIPLYPEDGGKEIRVVITPVYESFRERKVEFLMGSELSIYKERLKLDLPQIIIGSIAILVGMLFIMVAIGTMFSKKRDYNLAALGNFSVMLGLWRLTDTRFSPFMMQEKPVFLFYVSLAMLMLGGISLLKSIQYRYNKKFYPLFNYYCMALSVACMIQIILQITNIRDFRETLVVTHFMLLIGVFICAGVMIHDGLKSGRKKMNGLGKRMFMVCVAGVAADVLAFYVKGNSSGLLFTLTAFLIYIIISGFVSIWGYVEQERKMKQQEAELASSRISIMLSQIQPHFLYNSLNTIYHLCEKNPAKAQKAISDFSDYLRGNLESLKRISPVPFEKELEHVKIYLSLEKMRFDEELEIVYDIETTSFLIPALTVQPLVENAVKHGVGKTQTGGTVTISTVEREEWYEVVVADDGAGYDVNEVQDDTRTHIGIENVRKRLWEMSHATLEIFSEKGKGTRVVIKIPKGEMPDDDYGS